MLIGRVGLTRIVVTALSKSKDLTPQQTRLALAYRLIGLLLLPAVFVYTLKRANQDGDRRYFWQRLGWKIPVQEGLPVWIHCASVGEVNAARPLIERLIQDYPTLKFVLSTVTPTAAAVVKKTLPKSVLHVYLPFDTQAGVRHFLQNIQPRVGLVLETEIWPGLFAEVQRRNIPLVVVNGRLTDKTLAAPRWIRVFIRQALQAVRLVLAKSEVDAQGYQQLGVAPSRIKVLGNIKFAATRESKSELPRLVERDYWLAASTHEDEERQLAEMIGAREADPYLLVIAPRHPERAAAIERQLKNLGVRFAVRSRREVVSEDTQIYLADTLGELGEFMQHAAFVFMGGTLVPVGGHNLLEPAALGKAIVCGPYLDNFMEEAELLRGADALVEVKDADVLAQAIDRLLAASEEAKKRGQAAANAVATQTGVLDRYIDALKGIIALD